MSRRNKLKQYLNLVSIIRENKHSVKKKIISYLIEYPLECFVFIGHQ